VETEVFKGKIFRVTVENITPTLRYERVYQRNGVTVFPITEYDRIRFIKKTDPESRTTIIVPMSGYVEDGEEPLACAKRELAEELGLSAELWTPFTTAASVGGVKKIQYFFVARRLRLAEKRGNPDPNENITGTVDLTYKEVRTKILAGEFDCAGSEIAFALLKFVLDK